MQRHVTRVAASFLALAASTALCFAPQAGATTSAQRSTRATSAGPLDASGCNDDTCIYLGNPHNGQVEVQGWAYDTTFYGYFEFTGPNGLKKYAGPATWQGHEGNYAYIANAAVVGKYCVHGYLPGGYNEGTACENVE